MNYSQLRFRISAKRDFETLLAFAKEAVYDNGRNLNWVIFKKYSKLKSHFRFDTYPKIINKKALHSFVYETYRSQPMSMKRSMVGHQKRWAKIAPKYFLLVDELFYGRKWPSGKYIAFGTIWGMYPRFLKDKTFQIPYRHRIPKYVVVVIAHELLHFMFYDYFYKRHPKYRRSQYDFFVWHVSEIFNTIIQNSQTWFKLFKLRSTAYPEHQKIVAQLGRIWYRKKILNVDLLIKDIFKAVGKSKLAV